MIGAATPRGLGLYLGRVVREWDGAAARKHAERAKRARIRHVALCAEALDGWRADHGVLVRCAEVYRELGIDVWVYSLPGTKRLERGPDDIADALADAGVACGARGWILDAEEQARGLGGCVLRFRKRLMDRASERASIMVTFYGRIPSDPTRVHDFPWSAIVGWGSCGYQLYVSAEDDDVVDPKMEVAFRWWGPDVVPHLATYLGDAARLDGDIRRTCVGPDGRLLVLAIAFWQDSTTDDRERAVIAEWAVRLEDAARTQRADEPTQRLRPA